jgi:hypothetical protein
MSNLLEQASLVLIPSGYKEDVVYSEIPLDGSGDMNFTRSSDGTRINSAGLVEVTPWNLAQYSEDFSNAVWTLANVTVTANDITAPNGTLTADKFTISVNGCDVKQTISVLPNTVYTWSFYVYGGTALGQQGRFYDNTNLTNIEYYNYSSSVVLGAWVKIERTFTTPSGCYEIQAWVLAATSTIGTMWAWGCQLNIGSTAKPYFPTTDRLNVPRLTYQNGGGGCPSLLLEKQSTNLLNYSQELDNAYWNTYDLTVTGNSAISPDGTQNADLLSFDANATARLEEPVGGTYESQTHTVSVYAKVTSGTQQFRLKCTHANIADYYSSDLTVTTEWQRFTFTQTFGASVGSGIVAGVINSSSGTAKSILFYGLQLEANSSYATSYIPTTSASATRVADTYQKAGIGNTSTAGTLFYEFGGYQPSIPANAQYLLQLFAGSSVGDAFFSDANSISIINQGANIEGRNDGFSTTLFSFTPTSATVKVALRYNGTNVVAFVNGVKQTVYSDTAVGVKNAIRVNNGEYGSQATKQLIFFPTALTDAECISLTTI